MTQTGLTGKKWLRLIVILPVLLLTIGSANGQTAQFTYQGKLGDNGNAANGQYDFQFKLFDTQAVGSGTQQGSTVNVLNVQVTAGIFTVQLDFGAAAFPGADRFLEIAVTPAGGAAPTVLSPRQQLTSTPYAVRSAQAAAADTATNATQLGGLSSSGFIQNTNTPQSATNFNIGGTGTAAILNATTQFSLGGSSILSNAGTDNVFAGVGAGVANTSGFSNAFFGGNAGFSNSTGAGNSFFGNTAGGRNTTGGNNSFFGSFAGSFNSTGARNSYFGVNAGNFSTTATDNAFFGMNAGLGNTTGSFNAFFGKGAGNNNLTASGNSFFGTSAGFNNTTGQLNAFFGEGTGSENTIGSGNTFIGRDADFNTPGATGDNNTLLGMNTRVVSGVSNATAIGTGAVASTSNTVVLGTSAETVQVPGTLNIGGTFAANICNATTQFNIGGNRILSNAGTNNLFLGLSAGRDNTTGGLNTFVGNFAGQDNTTANGNSFFGLAAGQLSTTGSADSFFGFSAGANNTTGSFNTFMGNGSGSLHTTGSNDTFIGAETGLPTLSTPQVNNSTAIGFGATVSTSNTIVIGRTSETTQIPGKLVTNKILMNGGGAAIGGGDAEVFNTGPLEGVFTGNVVLYQLNTLLPSAVHLCTISTTVGVGLGGDALTRCTSSLSSVNNKTDVKPFSSGLDLIKRLKPVAFKWKVGGAADVGLNAEDVAAVAPLLVTRNEKGEVEDVKEGSLNVLLINALKEQQQQIEVLKALVCADHPAAAVCKSN